MTVRYEVDDPLGLITIDRPEHANAFTLETAEELEDAISRAVGQESVGAIVLRGAGDAFCTGADLGMFGRALEEGREVEVVSRLAGMMNRVIASIAEAPKPVVACIDGPVAGGGLGLALACDARVASREATFVPGFLSVGVSPDAGTTWFLPRMVGWARAREILLRDESLEAARAHEAGLVTELVDPGRTRERARALAGELAQLSGPAVASVKQRFLEPQGDLRKHLEAEREATAASADTDAFRAGVRSFLESRG